MATIAFIGLGNMGGPMAINLVKAGHQVTVFDLVPAAVKTVTDLGASSAATANGAASGAEFVITMLPASRHVESVYLGDNGLLAAVDNGAVVVDCSTIDAGTARKVAAAAKERGVAMVDAPVSGGVAGAAAGTLSFMCGGDDDTFARVKPINLGHIGRSQCNEPMNIDTPLADTFGKKQR